MSFLEMHNELEKKNQALNNEKLVLSIQELETYLDEIINRYQKEEYKLLKNIVLIYYSQDKIIDCIYLLNSLHTKEFEEYEESIYRDICDLLVKTI